MRRTHARPAIDQTPNHARATQPLAAGSLAIPQPQRLECDQAGSSHDRLIGCLERLIDLFATDIGLDAAKVGHADVFGPLDGWPAVASSENDGQESVSPPPRRDPTERGTAKKTVSRLRFVPGRDDPVVRGTDVPVGRVVSWILNGWSWAAIVRSNPGLTDDDIRACLDYTLDNQGPLQA